MSDSERLFVGTVFQVVHYGARRETVVLQNKDFREFCTGSRFSFSKFLSGLHGRRVVLCLYVLPERKRGGAGK